MNRNKYTAYLLSLISACSSFSKVAAGNHSCTGPKKDSSSQNEKKLGIKKWSVKNEDGKYIQCKLDRKSGHLSIIANKENTKICEIFEKENIFLRPYVKSISFEGDITSIENGAFIKCTNLKSIEFPINENFKKIGSGTFAVCKNLESIKIPDSVEKIGDYAFSNCTNLKSIEKFPDNKNFKKIGRYAFVCI